MDLVKQKMQDILEVFVLKGKKLEKKINESNMKETSILCPIFQKSFWKPASIKRDDFDSQFDCCL